MLNLSRLMPALMLLGLVACTKPIYVTPIVPIEHEEEIVENDELPPMKSAVFLSGDMRFDLLVNEGDTTLVISDGLEAQKWLKIDNGGTTL